MKRSQIPGLAVLGIATFLFGGGPLFSQQIIYNDVSATHLPLSDLTGSSMDARPADIDNDGDLDLVIASEFLPNIILINDGSGVFSNESVARLPQVNFDSEDVGIADFDGDGDLDIIFVSEDNATNEFYLNNGSGFFSDAGNRIPVAGTSNAVLAADIDSDGDSDIMIGNQGQNVILINDGSGFFTDETALRLPPNFATTQDLEWGDIDGDGDKDIVEGNENGNRLLFNNGTGFFGDSTALRLPLPAAGEETREADLGDIDNDGDLDLFLANVTFQQGRPSQNRLLRNDGSGFFTDITASHLPVSFQNTVDGDFIDLDDDGDLDIVLAQAFDGSFKALIQQADGTFLDRSGDIFMPVPTGNGIDIEAADFNNDGLTDLYLTGFQRADYLYLGEAVVAIDNNPVIFEDFILYQNYPNPFNPETQIRYQISDIRYQNGNDRLLNLTVFDVQGRKVRSLLKKIQPPGSYSVSWDGRDDDGREVASGVYYYRLQAGQFSQSRKMLLVR